MNRAQRIGLLGALAAVAVEIMLAPFLWLWAVAAWLLWHAWWRQAVGSGRPGVAAGGRDRDAALPAGRVFVPVFVGLLGGRAGRAAADRRVAGRGAALVSAGSGTVLDGAGGLGVGVNLGEAVWWPLLFLPLWAVPLGVVGAAAGSARAHRRRAREHGDLAPTI